MGFEGRDVVIIIVVVLILALFLVNSSVFLFFFLALEEIDVAFFSIFFVCLVFFRAFARILFWTRFVFFINAVWFSGRGNRSFIFVNSVEVVLGGRGLSI